MTILETARLTLRSWVLDDFEAFATMHAEPEVMQFIAGDGKPFTRFMAWQGFCATLGHWQLRGFGQFAVIERATGTFVGRVGPWHPEGWPGFEIGRRGVCIRLQRSPRGFERDHDTARAGGDHVAGHATASIDLTAYGRPDALYENAGPFRILVPRQLTVG